MAKSMDGVFKIDELPLNTHLQMVAPMPVFGMMIMIRNGVWVVGWKRVNKVESSKPYNQSRNEQRGTEASRQTQAQTQIQTSRDVAGVGRGAGTKMLNWGGQLLKCTQLHLVRQSVRMLPITESIVLRFKMDYHRDLLMLVLLLLLATTVQRSSASLLPDNELQSLIQTKNDTRFLYTTGLTPAQYLLSKVLSKSSLLDPQCAKHLHLLQKGWNNTELWALEYLDASAKGMSGKFAGYIHDMGNFDQCVLLQTDLPAEQVSFSGQYCAVSVFSSEYRLLSQSPKLEQNLRNLTEEVQQWIKFNLGHVYGLCIPSTCNPSQLFPLINSELQRYNMSLMVQKHCTVGDHSNLPFTWLDQMSIFTILLVASVTVFASLYPRGFMRHFSLKYNWIKLTQHAQTPETKRLQFLHGAKFLYIVVSLTAHCWFIFMPIFPLLYGGVKRYDIGNVVLEQVSAAALLIPDGMFFLSGFLAFYTWHPTIQKRKGNLSFIYYAFPRWIRMIPVLLGTYFLMRLAKFFGSGPFFNDIADMEYQKCSESLGFNLLFVSNWLRGLNMCMPQAWYISLDFQLYLIHYVPIILLSRKPTLGLIYSGFQIVATSTYLFLRTYLNHFPGYFRVNEINIINLYDTEVQYLNTFLHCSPYTIGVLTGYFVRVKPDGKHLNTLWYLPIFAFTFVVSIVPLAAPYLFIQGILPHNQLLLAFWSCVFRSFFTIGFSYGLYLVYHGKFVGLNKVLRLQFMVPISRMALSIVISQYVYIMYLLASARRMQLFTTFAQIKEGIAGYVIIVAIGLITYLLFEAPMVNVMYSIFARSGIKEPTQLVKSDKQKSNASDPNNNIVKANELCSNGNATITSK